MGLFNTLFFKKTSANKISNALHKSNKTFFTSLSGFFNNKKNIDASMFEALEESLYMSDISSKTIQKILTQVQKSNADNVYEDLKKNVLNIFYKNEMYKDTHKIKYTPPHVFLIIGINGVGKTTTIAKLANQFKQNNFSSMLCAADTFRAAATEQLTIWADKINIPIIKKEQGADPSSVVFNAVESALAKKIDFLLIDTAGRLHNKTHLMGELEKIKKTILKKIPTTQLETLLIIDGTTGQNSLTQLREFLKVADINGLIVTKLDGTSKGGFIISIADEFNIPIKFIGVGEGINDIVEFEPEVFVNSLFAIEKV